MVYVWCGYVDDVEERDYKAGVVSDKVDNGQCLDTIGVNL